MKTATIFIASILILAAPECQACSFISFPPNAMPSDWTLLSGVVTGHPVANIEELGSTPGVQILVEQSTNTRLSGTVIQLFPLGIGLECEPRPREVATVVEQFPVGAAVTAVVDGVVSDPELILLPQGFGDLAIAPTGVPRLSNGCLDFEFMWKAYQRSTEFDRVFAWANYHRGGYEDYELLQCYRVLAELPDPEEKMATLENVGFFRFWLKSGESGFARKHYYSMLRRQGLGWRERRKVMKTFDASRELAN